MSDYAPKDKHKSLCLRFNGEAPEDITDNDVVDIVRFQMGLSMLTQDDLDLSSFKVKDVMLADGDAELADKLSEEHIPEGEDRSREVRCSCGMPDADWRSKHDPDAQFDFVRHLLFQAGWDVTDG